MWRECVGDWPLRLYVIIVCRVTDREGKNIRLSGPCLNTFLKGRKDSVEDNTLSLHLRTDDMAAIYGSGENIWSKSIEEEFEVLQRLLKNDFPTITLITGVAIAVLGPVTMTANAIVLAAIWKDPYKQLRSSPSNIIIASMACCDFLVGTLCSFMQSFWLLNMSVKSDISLYVAPVAFGIGIYLIGVSVMHVLALTIDRVVSVANPLLYKARVTRRRVVISVVMIWVSFILMGAMGGPLHNHYYIHNIIGTIVLSLAVMTTSCLALYIIFRVRRQTQQLKKNAGVCISARGSTSRDRKLTKRIVKLKKKVAIMRDIILGIAFVFTIVSGVFGQSQDNVIAGSMIAGTRVTNKILPGQKQLNSTEIILTLENRGNLVDGLINKQLPYSPALKAAFKRILKVTNYFNNERRIDFTLSLMYSVKMHDNKKYMRCSMEKPQPINKKDETESGKVFDTKTEITELNGLGSKEHKKRNKTKGDPRYLQLLVSSKDDIPSKVSIQQLNDGKLFAFDFANDKTTKIPSSRELVVFIEDTEEEKKKKLNSLGATPENNTLKEKNISNLMKVNLGNGMLENPAVLFEMGLILDLSSPGSGSVNDGIDPDNVSLQYIRIDQIISMVSQYGQGALMAKFDVEAAYRNIAVPASSDDEAQPVPKPCTSNQAACGLFVMEMTREKNLSSPMSNVFNDMTLFLVLKTKKTLNENGQEIGPKDENEERNF
ncbi:hypothetical protein QZH41_004634 [Actinostola sp. cb2023]|nr:hypothetical protein QZH41_004634 [Actinostola sp. cb2023]